MKGLYTLCMQWWQIILWCVLGLIGGILFIHLVIIRIIRHIWKFPIPSWAVELIEGPHRRRVQPPELVIKWMGIKPGIKVLELGPGAGVFTFPASMIAEEIHAVDIQPEVIEIMKRRMKEIDVNNIHPVVSDAHTLPYPDKYFDMVFHVACLPEIPDPVGVLKEVRRVLKDDGVYADGELFFDPDYPLASTVVSWAKRAGLEKVSANGNGIHYVLTFTKNQT